MDTMDEKTTRELHQISCPPGYPDRSKLRPDSHLGVSAIFYLLM
jgi:hypothetical protein